MVIENYTLLFPASFTWFCFDMDLLYPEFLASAHKLPFEPRHLTTSAPDQNDIFTDPHIWSCDNRIPRRYHESVGFLPPQIDANLLKRVKNLVLARTGEHYYAYHRPGKEPPERVLDAFPNLELLVFADNTRATNHDVDQELCWLSGRLGEETRSPIDAWRETDSGWFLGETPYLGWQLWDWPVNTWYVHRAEESQDPFVEKLANLIASSGRQLPLIVRKVLITVSLKNRLVEICGAEDKLRDLDGLDWGFVQGKHEYSGPLSLSQQINFLKLAEEKILLMCDRNCSWASRRVNELGEDLSPRVELCMLLEKIEELDIESMAMQEGCKEFFANRVRGVLSCTLSSLDW